MAAPSMGAERAGARVVVLGPGKGRPIPGREEVVLKATGADTGGAVAFLEATTAPGDGPSPHVHHDNDELFYVLEGRMRFRVGEREVEAGAGAFLFVPRGTVHAARNVGAGPVRLLRLRAGRAGAGHGGVRPGASRGARPPGPGIGLRIRGTARDPARRGVTRAGGPDTSGADVVDHPTPASQFADTP